MLRQLLRATDVVTITQIDLEVGSWYVSTHPKSIFVTNLTAALVTDDRPHPAAWVTAAFQLALGWATTRYLKKSRRLREVAAQ